METLGTKPVYWELDETDGYRFDEEKLKTIIGPRTKLICVYNPHNPTGRVMTREELKTIADIAVEYDTEDTTVVLSRERCGCGRTHMRIVNPQREAETIWIFENPFNRVDIESAVFQHQNMEYLTGEYEGFVHEGDKPGKTVLRVNLECFDPERCDRRLVEDGLLHGS